MNTKTYRADNISDALGLVKEDFGRDAVILKTRSFRKGGFLGLIGGKPVWEVIACPSSDMDKQCLTGKYVSDQQDVDKLSDSQDSNSPNKESNNQDNSFVSEANDSIASKNPIITVPFCERENKSENGGLSRQVDELKKLVEIMLEKTSISQAQNGGCGDIHGLKARMIDQAVYPEIAEELIAKLRMELSGSELADKETCRQKLCDMIAGRIKTVDHDFSHNGKAKVISLIGPTGVGKTTTIAKLAANFKLHHQMRVGLITIDTYRIAAVDQLRTYAEIIEVPLRTVLDGEQMMQAVYALRGMDVILLDTTGRSQNDLLRLKHLRSFLESAGVDEVHLVISATANRRCADTILRNFLPLGANRLLVTKLDESAGWGTVLNLAWSNIGPITYITSGQEVPDDIKNADSKEIAKRIIGGQEYER